MFNRGNATSGDPICNGINTLPNPKNNGVANNNNMIVPCIVNSWLYTSSLTNCIPGFASSDRMINAITPATRNHANDVPRYSFPITLWSVVVRVLMIFSPSGRRGGPRWTLVDGSTAVTSLLLRVRARVRPG